MAYQKLNLQIRMQGAILIAKWILKAIWWNALWRVPIWHHIETLKYKYCKHKESFQTFSICNICWWSKGLQNLMIKSAQEDMAPLVGNLRGASPGFPRTSQWLGLSIKIDMDTSPGFQVDKPNPFLWRENIGKKGFQCSHVGGFVGQGLGKVDFMERDQST